MCTCPGFYKHIISGVGNPLTGIGIEDRTTIRGLVDIGVWFSVLEEHELKFLRNTRKRAGRTFTWERERGGLAGATTG